MESTFLFTMDIMGTIAFAISGNMLAVKKNMDLLGICILGIITAVGGGALRDVVMGRTPPVMFQDPSFVFIATLTSCLFFLFARQHGKIKSEKHHLLYERLLFWSDTLGLGAFTVDGAIAGMNLVSDGGLFLYSFLGVMTGVGGGILRDILAQEIPSIFIRHVYACASMVGALLTSCLYGKLSSMTVILLGFSSVVLIRALSAHYRWSLPHA